MANIREMTPDTHIFLHKPRPDRKAGGVGICLSKIFYKVKEDKSETSISFEHIQVSGELGGEKFVFIVVYRPPNADRATFLTDFSLYPETVDAVSKNVFIMGDFNLWVDDATDYYAIEFIEMMNSFDFVSKVTQNTTSTGHNLDLVFSDERYDLIR